MNESQEGRIEENNLCLYQIQNNEGISENMTCCYNIFTGDSYNVLRMLNENLGQRAKYKLIVTSPPYYGHRHYGNDVREVGREKTPEIFIEKLAEIFTLCRELLTEDGSLWIVIGDTRRRYRKCMIPHRLVLKLIEKGYNFKQDIIWYNKNNVSSSSQDILP